MDPFLAKQEIKKIKSQIDEIKHDLETGNYIDE